jgi:NADH dehydrogenase FAD-containing subunit
MNLTWRRSGGARLVLALGSEPRMNMVPGAAELAIPFSTLEDALVSQATLSYEKCFATLRYYRELKF